MKILAIGDIHENYKDAINNIKAHIDEVDFVVVLGDYIDSFHTTDVNVFYNGFTELCKLVRENNKIKLCIGNHDLENGIVGGGCSGFQYHNFETYYKMFNDNIDLLNIAYDIDGWVFSHAGFSSNWTNAFLAVRDATKPVDEVNRIFHLMFKDGKLSDFSWLSWFRYENRDWSGYGNSTLQGPLWIRPEALLGYHSKEEKMFFDKQVVGHTEHFSSPVFYTNRHKQKLIVVDSQPHNTFCIIDTKKDDFKYYSVVENERKQKTLRKKFFDEKSKNQ